MYALCIQSAKENTDTDSNSIVTRGHGGPAINSRIGLSMGFSRTEENFMRGRVTVNKINKLICITAFDHSIINQIKIL